MLSIMLRQIMIYNHDDYTDFLLFIHIFKLLRSLNWHYLSGVSFLDGDCNVIENKDDKLKKQVTIIVSDIRYPISTFTLVYKVS